MGVTPACRSSDPLSPQLCSHWEKHTRSQWQQHSACVGFYLFIYFCILFLQYHEFSFPLQNAMLGNGLVLQNLLHMQLAQQQLLHIKDKRISSVRSLFICMCAWECLDHLHSGRLGIGARRSSCEHQHVSYVPSYFYHRHFSCNETEHPQHHAE